MNKLTTFDFPFARFSVGFDNLFNELSRASTTQLSLNYPPYDLIKLSEDKYRIDLAIAGFKEEDIKIVVEKDVLVVSGEKVLPTEEPESYIHRGISGRRFERRFDLVNHVQVVNAKLDDGILSIDLERQIPEEAKPKFIQITHK